VLDHALDFDFNGEMGKRARYLVISFFFLATGCFIFSMGCIYHFCKSSRLRSNDQVTILADETELKGKPMQLPDISTGGISTLNIVDLNDVIQTEEAEKTVVAEQSNFDSTNNFESTNNFGKLPPTNRNEINQ